MAEKTFLSPAVSTREIDLSQPTSIQPSGVPAGVIGTARRGPAFVPVTVATFQDFVAKFGNTDGESFGPLAMNEWMRNANAGTYVRLLGAGNAKARTDEGRVTNAGFIAGSAGVQANGKIGVNPYAVAGSDQLGRAYILGCFMADNGSSTVLTDSDLAGTGSQPIVRGVLMFPSGVVPTLSSVQTKGTNTAKATAVGGSADKPQGTAAGLGGGAFGDVNTSNKYGAGNTASPTRAVFGGDYPSSSANIDYTQIATIGNVLDFGDLTQGRGHFGALSNGHGGL